MSILSGSTLRQAAESLKVPELCVGQVTEILELCPGLSEEAAEAALRQHGYRC